MAMSFVIRKASPTVVPLALRAISSPRINLTGSFPNAIGCDNLVHFEKEAFFLSNQFSSAAAVDNNNVHDKKFLKVLKSQIKLAKRLDSKRRVLRTPNNFPFTIKDNPARDSITLERMLHGEKIEVEVDMPSVIKEDEEEELDSDISSSDDEEKEEKSITSPAPTVPMTLTITKENRDHLNISLLASSDEVMIEDVWMMIKNLYIDGPEFEALASDVQYGLKKFIKNIGIEESYVEFLYKYMVRKSKRKEMLWMEKLKKFVEK